METLSNPAALPFAVNGYMFFLNAVLSVWNNYRLEAVIVYGLLIYLIIYNEIKPFVEVTRLKQVLLGSTLGFLFWGYSFIYPSPVLTYLREQTRLNELIIGFMLVLGNFIITILLIPLTAASYCFICSFADEYRKRATKKT